MNDLRAEHELPSAPDEDRIEWLERGWPLHADGSCDLTLASEQGVVAMSSGLAALDRPLRSEIFNARGGEWNKFGPTPFEESLWPAGFPCSLVLRAEPRLRSPLGHDLVLALLEWRGDPSGRRFMRCLWFLLPLCAGEALDAGRLGAACDLLLTHRGRPARPADTPPLVFPAAGDRRSAPDLEPVAGNLFRARVPATPSELMTALVTRAAEDDDHGAASLARGLAVLCSPHVAREVGLGVVAAPDLLPSRWRHPLPIARPPAPLTTAAPEPAKELPPAVPPARDPPAAASLRYDGLAVVTQPEVATGPRPAHTARIAPVALGLHALQLGLLTALVVRGYAPVDASCDPPAPGPASAGDSAAANVATPSAPPLRLRPTIAGNHVAASVLSAALPPGASEPTADELGVLSWLAPSGPLAVIGFAAAADCAESDRAARSRAESTAQWLRARGEVQTIVIGARAEPPRPQPPYETTSTDTLIVSDRAAGEWRALAATPCPRVATGTDDPAALHPGATATGPTPSPARAAGPERKPKRPRTQGPAAASSPTASGGR